MVEAVVEFDYEAVNGDELTMTKGEIISNINMMEGGWWEGELGTKRGMFPDNFVKIIEKPSGTVKQKPTSASPPSSSSSIKSHSQGQMANGEVSVSSGTKEPPPEAKVIKREGGSKKRMMRAKVAFSYNPQNEDELELIVDEWVEVLDQPEEGWWEGVVKGKQGLFPSNFVTLVDEDESHEGKTADAPPASSGGTTPMDEEKPVKKQIKSSGMGHGNIFAGGMPHLKKTPVASKDHSSPKTESHPFAVKRMSLRNAKPEKAAEEEKKDEEKTEKNHTTESSKGVCRVRVSYDYEPKNADELQLKKGEIVNVLDKDAGDSGWWRGEVNGKIGVFPDNFTEEIPPEEKPKKKTVPPAPVPARPTSGPTRPVSTDLGSSAPKPSVPKQMSQDNLKISSKETAVNGSRHLPAGATRVLPPPTAGRPQLFSKPVAAKKPTSVNSSLDAKEALKDETDSSKTDAKDLPFDDIKINSEKLTHLNKTRAKASGNRRPPSSGYVLGQSMQGPPSAVENGPPGRPKTLPAQVPGPAPAGTKADTSSAPPRPAAVSTSKAPANNSSGTASAKDSTSTSGASASEVQDLRKEIKSLHETIASIKTEFKREVKKLMTEVDEEKKHRMMMQVELERIKKLVMEGD